MSCSLPTQKHCILKILRQKHKISQMQLELQANLCLGTISRIENEKINPTKETLIRIAKALDLNADEILMLFGVDWIV